MLLTRPRQETRSTAEVLAILDGQGEYTDSGTLITTSKALQQSTVWSCVRILAETIASLPVKVQRRQSGQWVDTVEHPANKLLMQPNDWQTSHEYFSFLVIWSELRGNSYYLKAKDSRGDTKKMYPIQADDVTVEFTDSFQLIYKIQDGKQRGTFSTGDIFHLRNLGNDGYMGLSTISQMRNTIGMALSTEQHGNKLFKNGAQPGLVVTAPSANEEQIKLLQRKIDDKFAGSMNAYRTMILQGDMSVDTLSMTQQDAQYLETRHFTKQEIASAFGVPMFVLNDTQKSTTWGTGLEQQLRAFKTLSLQPRLNRIVQTLQRELLGRNERSITRFVFDTDALTLGDFRDRMDGYRSGIESGVLNPNEAREIEGRNPRDGGDEYRKPLNIGIEGDENEESDFPANEGSI